MKSRVVTFFPLLALTALPLTPCGVARAAAVWTYGSTSATSGQQASQLAPNPAATVPGTIGFVFTNGGFTLLNGSVSIDVSRTGGSAGAVSVVCSTQDGSAAAGVDYSATSTTLSWADGDTSNKTFTVPTINRGLAPGTTLNFSIGLNNPAGGADLDSTGTVLYTIRYDSVAPQPTVEITNPPMDVTLISGTAIILGASLTDPGSIATLTQFYLNGSLYSQSTGKGPFALPATVPPPGTYVLKVVVTDNQQRQSTSTRTVTAVADNPADPTPATSLYTDLEGRTLAGGSTIILSGMAESLSADGSPLAKVAFYADTTLIAAYDGYGNLLSGSGESTLAAGNTDRHTSAERRRTASGSGGAAQKGSVYTAAWTIPNLDKLINLLTVATTVSGRSQVSTATMVQAKAITAGSNQPPAAVIKSVSNGRRVRTGIKLTVPVAVTDPDAAPSTSSIAGNTTTRRLSAIGVPGSVISKVEFFLNQAKLATATQPPFSIDFTPSSEGTYVIEAIATDDAGLAGIASPLVVNAVSTSPTVALSIAGAGGNSVTVAGGAKAKLFFTRSNDDLTEPLTVNYKVKGSAVSGVDFKTLAGTVTIPAGASSTKIKVRTFNDGVADGATLLKLKVVPDANGVYGLGAPAVAKVRIED